MSKQKKGLILINAFANPLHHTQAIHLAQELEMLNINSDIKSNNFFAANIKQNGQISLVKDYSFCVYLDKDKYISHMLEKAGVKIFNSHSAIRDCDDKMTTHIQLAQKGINMPKTLSGFLCYDKSMQIDKQTAHFVAQELGLPVVVKKCFGSLGASVFLAKTVDELYGFMTEFKCEPHLFQEYIGVGFGQDIRVIVIGGKVVAAMKRTNRQDFRSNIELGGTGEKINICSSVVKMAQKAASILQLDYCGVDILEKENKYYLCEVNSNAYFSEIERVTGVNIAKLYAKHISKNI